MLHSGPNRPNLQSGSSACCRLPIHVHWPGFRLPGHFWFNWWHNRGGPAGNVRFPLQSDIVCVRFLKRPSGPVVVCTPRRDFSFFRNRFFTCYGQSKSVVTFGSNVVGGQRPLRRSNTQLQRFKNTQILISREVLGTVYNIIVTTICYKL